MIRSALATFPALILLQSCSAPSEPQSGGRDTIYVTNEHDGSLSAIDGATLRIVGSISLGKRPRGIVASQDGKALYIALSGSPASGPGVDESKLPPADKAADGIAVFDIAKQRVIKVLRGVSDPEQLALSSDGRRLFVASEDAGLLVAMDSRTGAVTHSIPVGGEPEGVAVSPGGEVVAVTSEADNRISILDARTLAIRFAVNVGKRPRGVVFSMDGKTLFVTNEEGHSVSIVNVVTGKVSGLIQLDASLRPMGIVAVSGRGELYVSTGRGGKVARLDIQTLKQDAIAPAGTRPWGIGVSTDGKNLYAASGPSNDVWVIDTGTFRAKARVTVGESPWGLVVVKRR